ncbi:hypothetical protein [Streptomyces sp. C1-2]|uniref:DUF6197 family protein n=1 Tax=Streptomyces sp. C1-2 TaxID=2720022 RepID=UPI001432546E|nr:hypothetical protein [Streptomyces sp. C1-2]NJP70413.1 hypothetical protein [Streptomyces sp. C1-2]
MATSLQTSSGVCPLHESPLARPTTIPGVFRAASRLLAANGLWKGDFCPDPRDQYTSTPHSTRPLSIVAAVMCVATGDPHVTSPLAEEAVSVLAMRLEVDGEAPETDLGWPWTAMHVDEWGDFEGRTTESAVAVLEAAADANEVSA